MTANKPTTTTASPDPLLKVRDHSLFATIPHRLVWWLRKQNSEHHIPILALIQVFLWQTQFLWHAMVNAAPYGSHACSSPFRPELLEKVTICSQFKFKSFLEITGSSHEINELCHAWKDIRHT